MATQQFGTIFLAPGETIGRVPPGVRVVRFAPGTTPSSLVPSVDIRTIIRSITPRTPGEREAERSRERALARERERIRLAEQARRKAIQDAINEANRRKLSIAQRNKLLAQTNKAFQEEEQRKRSGFKKKIKEFGVDRDVLGKRITIIKTPDKIIISTSGAVTIGRTKYTGNAVVPGTGGMTANEYARKVKRDAVSSGQIKQKDIGRTKITFTPQKDLFIEQKIIRVIRIKGKDVQITKTFVVDSTGRIVRKATPEEEEIARKSQKKVSLPSDIITGTTPEITRRIETLTQKEQRGDITVKESIELAGLITAGTFIGGAVALLDLPKAPESIITISKKVIADPKLLLEIPSAIKRGGGNFGQVLKTSPTTAFAKIGANIFLLHVSGKVLKVVGKVSSRVATRISPKFRGVRRRAISIPSRQKGKTLTIKIRSKLGRAKLPSQVALAGKKVTAVSAQADKLIKFIRTKRIIRKPIRGEKGLTKLTKKLLKRFDEGTITKKQLISLDRRIRKEAKKGLLERSFFADPSGVARKRFLKIGTEKEASLLDILSGDVTFKTSRPQLLVFEKVKVQAFPKTKIFKSITSKLKTGKTLTQAESTALLKFQLKKTGKFKPVGFQTSELEITLAPGEVVKKVKTVAVTLINGKRVPIIQAKVVKATASTKKLLSKAKKGKLTAKELKTLRKKLKKETGFSSSISDSAISKPRLPLGRKALSIAIRPRRRIARRKPVRRKVPVRRVVRRKVVRKPVTRKVVRKPVVRKAVKRKVVVRKVTRPGVVKPAPTRFPFKKPKPKKKKLQPVPTFDVLGKSGKKFVKINKIPLSRNDALSRGTFAIDHSTSKTFKIVPAGKRKKVGSVSKVEKNYFNRAGFKLREFRVKGGRKFAIKPKYIEKTKYGIDTRGEKRGLTLARLAKQRGFVGTRKLTRVRIPVRKPTRRKATPQQLRNLAKGRKILAQKRKKS